MFQSAQFIFSEISKNCLLYWNRLGTGEIGIIGLGEITKLGMK